MSEEIFHQVHDISIIGPAGELDPLEGRFLLEKIRGLIEANWAKIVLDLGEVSHIHYRFLADLLRLQRRSPTGSGGIKLANPTPYTREILKVTGADRFFETYDSVAEAILSFDTLAVGTCEMH